MARFRQCFPVCSLLMLNAILVCAQPPIVVDSTFRQVVVSHNADLLEDPSGRLTITDVQQTRLPFKRYPGTSINLGFSTSMFWVRFRVYNSGTASKDLLLEVENPHINKLRLFSQTGQGPVQAGQLTGDHFPFRQRPIRHPHFLFPITVAPGQTLTGYLWVDKHGEQVQIPLRLWDKAYFSNQTYTVYLFAGFMLGVIGLYCMLSLLVLLFFRLRLTLYYFLYTSAVWLFLAAHTGLGFMFIWPNATWWTSAARPTTALLIYVFSLLFIRIFFRLANTHRRLYQYTRVLLGLLVSLILIYWLHNPALGLFKNYWYNPVYYPGERLLQFMIAVHLITLTSLISVIAIGVFVYYRTRHPEALWVAIGFLTTLLSGFSIILVHAGYVSDNYITQNLPLMANALDAIILSVLLANRFRHIHVQNAQISAELAEQRQQNAIQLLEGQFIERKRLSQELHDGISLSLATIRLRLSVLAEKLNGQGSEAQELVESLGVVGQDVRQFSHALSPVLLERYGLAIAIDELTEMVVGSHPALAVSFSHMLTNDNKLPLLVTQTTYQILLELLNNVGKHAQARSVTISLVQHDNRLMLDVIDDGVGYDLTEKTRGIGLQNIQARVSLLNGLFTVTRLPVGMKHQLILPL